MALSELPLGPWTVYEPGKMPLPESGFPSEKVLERNPLSALVNLRADHSHLEPADFMPITYKSHVTEQNNRYALGEPLSWTSMDHIASPEVVVDEKTQRIIIIYHGQPDSRSQYSRVAVSSNGLDF